MIDLNKLKEAYKPPFICDDESATIDDSDGNAVIVVRGWSRLNPLFGHDDAFKFQLQIAHFIAATLNEIVKGETARFYTDEEENPRRRS